jgi:hypothetical protein
LTSYEVDGETRYSAGAAPLLAASIAPDVQSIDGLSSLAEPTAQPDVATGGPQPSGSGCPAEASDSTPVGNNATAPLSFYYPDQLATQYDFDGFYETGDEGGGQTIALVEFEPYSQSDIDAYANCLGISDANVTHTDVAGGIAQNTMQSGEAALDIEDLLGLAPQAKIDVYEAPAADAAAEWNAVVSGDAQIVSTSWGSCEPAEEANESGFMATENTDLEEAASQGQTVLAASGDSGSSACLPSNGSSALAVEDPASQPFVTGVGGTSLADLGTPGTETVWNDDGTQSSQDGAGGGGFSNFWEEPTYQSGVTADTPPAACGNAAGGAAASVPTGCRMVPDVSADADPDTGYPIYQAGAWELVGGTSAAAPLWAAYIALANQSSGSNCAGGNQRLGFLNPSLYAAAASTSTYARDFRDVSSGDIAVSSAAQGAYPAGSGFDLASGLGTPNGTLLAGTLCADPLAVTPIANLSTAAGTTATGTVGATPSSGSSYRAVNLPPGVSLDAGTGAFGGAPESMGTFFPTVVVSNGSSTSEQTFTWTVTHPLVQFTGAAISSQSWIVQNPIAPLALSATDNQGGTITYTATGLPAGVSISSGGVIAGSPQAVGSGTATITATSSGAGTSAGQDQFSWSVAATSISVSAVADQTWTVGTQVSLAPSATDTSPSATLTFAATGLPPGLSMSPSTGLISGTPNGAQAAQAVQVTVTDGTGTSASETFSVVVAAAAEPASDFSGVATLSSTEMSSSSGTSSPPGGPVKAAPPPSVRADVSGTSTLHPRLTVTVKATAGKLSEIVIHLPRGFTASRSPRKLRAGIKVSLAGARVTVSGTTVMIALSGPRAIVTFTPAELSVARSLAAAVKLRQVRTETFSVVVIDAGARSTAKVVLPLR